jgi:hypothetical protein
VDPMSVRLCLNSGGWRETRDALSSRRRQQRTETRTHCARERYLEFEQLVQLVEGESGARDLRLAWMGEAGYGLTSGRPGAPSEVAGVRIPVDGGRGRKTKGGEAAEGIGGSNARIWQWLALHRGVLIANTRSIAKGDAQLGPAWANPGLEI